MVIHILCHQITLIPVQTRFLLFLWMALNVHIFNIPYNYLRTEQNEKEYFPRYERVPLSSSLVLRKLCTSFSNPAANSSFAVSQKHGHATPIHNVEDRLRLPHRNQTLSVTVTTAPASTGFFVDGGQHDLAHIVRLSRHRSELRPPFRRLCGCVVLTTRPVTMTPQTGSRHPNHCRIWNRIQRNRCLRYSTCVAAIPVEAEWRLFGSSLGFTSVALLMMT